MVKMLVISDIIKEQEKVWRKSLTLLNTDIVDWHSVHPRSSDYEIVILDMNLNRMPNHSTFENKRDDIYKQLISGGIVICLTSSSQKRFISSSRRGDVFETNYDWLSSTHKDCIKFDEDAGHGDNIEPKTKNELILNYLRGVKYYEKTIGGIVCNKDDRCYYIELDSFNYKVDVLTVNKVTGEPIACIIHYGKGRIVFLPQNSDINNLYSGIAYSIVENLYDIGKELYEKGKEEIGSPIEAPIWIDKYKSENEKDIERKIKEKEEELESLKKDHRRFELIDLLLYGYDVPLEGAVKKVFEEWGCEVEKTEIGATIDLKVRHRSLGIMFAIEVTGVRGKIPKKSAKFPQVMTYHLKKEDNEHIIVVANTYRDKDVTDRNGENFTPDAIKMAIGHKFCLITTVDLFNLWKDFLNGRSSEEILNGIFESNGEYSYKPNS